MAIDYPYVDLYVTGVGLTTSDDDVRDKMRVEWIREHADETLKSMTFVAYLVNNCGIN